MLTTVQSLIARLQHTDDFIEDVEDHSLDTLDTVFSESFASTTQSNVV